MTGRTIPTVVDGRALELFERRLEIDESQRDAWLDAQCGNDAAWRESVRRLQRADASVGGFLSGNYTDHLRGSTATGTRIGPYRIDRRIAEGGMGAVYKAHRDDGAYQQDVAVKFIRPLLMDAEAIRRFETERQILANLRHPNIAQMLDGGTTADGIPYVVMEFIDGVAITHYCTRHQLGLAQRLKLFRAVCAAVEEAHRNLVVHRDLKPGNILVTSDGEAKLLDFGIAKILRAGRVDETVTATSAALTPSYASPEQVQNHGITTASDVYSLGVLLYELLTDQRPYSLTDKTAAEAERLICEQTPPLPSEAVSEPVPSGELQDATGNRTRRKAGKRARTLRGDLDTITMMALRKQPERRYGSVRELSEDVQNYLRGLPVSARRDSTFYRLRRFSSRHRWGVATAALPLVSVLAGIATTGWQAHRAQQQAAHAEVQRLKAEKIGAFYKDILTSSSAQWVSKIGKGPNVTMGEVLDFASQRADSELAGLPEIHADVLNTISQSQQGMALYDNALDSSRRAVAVADSKLPPEHVLRATTHYLLANALMGKGEFKSAAREFDIAIARGDRLLPSESEIRALMHNDYAVFLAGQQRLRDAEREQKLAIELQYRRTHGKVNPLIAIGFNNLCAMRTTSGNLAGAEHACSQAIETFAQLPDRDYAERALALHNRSKLKVMRGDFAGAASDAAASVQVARSLYGTDNPMYALVLLNQASINIALGNTEQVPQSLSEAQKILEQKLAASHPYRARLQLVLGELHLAQGEYAQAQKSLNAAQRILDPKDSADKTKGRDYTRLLMLQGTLQLRLHRPDKARDLLAKSLAVETALYGTDIHETRHVQQLLDEANAQP